MKRLISFFMIAVFGTIIAFANGQGDGAKAGDDSQPKWVKSVELLVPARAGGGTDLVGRSIASQMAGEASNTITVVNNTDGNGVVPMEKVRLAKTNGSSLLLFHSTMIIKSATKVYNHNILDDFSVLGVGYPVEKASYVLVISADSPYKSLDDLVAGAKSAPNTLLFGVETGGTAHIESGLFAKAAGIKVRFVEAGSDTEKLMALVGKSIDACFVTPNQARQYVQSGKAIALAAVSTDETGGRSSVLPDVPSFIELGYNFSFSTYFFLLGPKGMDSALVNQIHDYFAAASESDAVNSVLKPAGLAMGVFEQSKGLAAIKAQQDSVNAIVQELGLVKK